MLFFDYTPRLIGDNGVYLQTFFLNVPRPNAVFTGYSPGIVNPKKPLENGYRRRTEVQYVKALHEIGSYQVVSAVPGITPQHLKYDSADTNWLHTTKRVSVPARVRELASSITSGSTSDYEKAARLERFLLGNYGYDLGVPPLVGSGDVVESFLFDRRAGYCAQFATAMAVMAQSVGLPARVATGYLPGKYNSLSGVHVVRRQDAHAWVEIKFKKNGWVPFDPTPRPDSPWDSYTGITKVPLNPSAGDQGRPERDGDRCPVCGTWGPCISVWRWEQACDDCDRRFPASDVPLSRQDLGDPRTQERASEGPLGLLAPIRLGPGRDAWRV